MFFRDPNGLEGELCVPNPEGQPGVYHPPGTPAPGEAVGALEPQCLSGEDAARLVELFAEAERLAAAGRTLPGDGWRWPWLTWAHRHRIPAPGPRGPGPDLCGRGVQGP